VCATNDYYFNFKDICFKNNFTLNRGVTINPDYLKVLLKYAEENLTVVKIFFKVTSILYNCFFFVTDVKTKHAGLGPVL
jgi:hypothetical protein